MLAITSRSRRFGRGLAFLACLTTTFLAAKSAHAQLIGPGQSIPSQLYFATQPLYYDGNYRAALATFAAESRSSIRTPNGPWLDSIMYLTMIGECHYQLGQLPQALANYDAALKIYVAYYNWMLSVRFPLAIAPAQPGAVRLPTWGQSRRGARVGLFEETYMMQEGRVDNSATFRQGGVVQQAVQFPVNAAEIVRCTSLAIRRRRELLGPIGKYDPLTNDLINVLSRRPGPPNHWSEAWVQVQLGCAYAAAGDTAQAKAALERGVLVGGEYDHPLTSTALLELGRLALESGDFVAGGKLLEEATFASATFLNPSNLEEAFRYAVLAHQLLNQKAAYTPLVPAIAWAKTMGLRELQASLSVLAADNLAALGQAEQASGMLSAATGLLPRSDLAISQLGARFNHSTALVAYQTGNVTAGDRALGAALGFLRSGSLWMFQIALADARYTSGEYSDRVGTALYEVLLRDPTPGDWVYSPLECLSVLTTPHSEVLEHWFEAAIENTREQELALEIADRARRHRFLSTLPMGGRLLALRWILEGPTELLGERGVLERQEILARHPEYQQLADRAAAARAKLAALPVVPDNDQARTDQAGQLSILADVSQQQEVLLRQIAVRREPSDLVFPPQRKTEDVQKSLGEGQVLMAFFRTRQNLYGFVYSRDQYATWRVQSPTQLQKQVATLLRDMGNYDANHALPAAELSKDAWRTSSARVLDLLLARSNVDLAGNFHEIAIVPDGFLWYLPFEALFVGKPEARRMLISQAQVRYAPTVGLAVGYARVQKPRPKVGVVVGKLFPQDDDAAAPAACDELVRAVTGAAKLPAALPVPSSVYRTLLDGLVVLDDVEPTEGPYDWSPAQLDRGKPGAALDSWLLLPLGGPELVALPGYHTAAEAALRKSGSAGDEMFLSVCGLLASGTRTVLMSRWRTAGQTSFDLVREFVQELPHTTPADAWQRSVQIVSDTELDPAREPRIANTSGAGEPRKASHPFFWAGYMLIDTGSKGVPQENALAAPGAAAPPKDDAAPGAPQAPMPANGNPATAPTSLLPGGIGAPAADAPPEDPPAKNGRVAKPKSSRATPAKPPRARPGKNGAGKNGTKPAPGKPGGSKPAPSDPAPDEPDATPATSSPGASP
ncbi:MAG: CHAT domain-containing protein [Pirellulales bacterium]